MTVYLIKTGARTGPFTIEQVVESIRKGDVQMTDLAWLEGMVKWKPIHSVPVIVAATLPPISQAHLKPKGVWKGLGGVGLLVAAVLIWGLVCNHRERQIQMSTGLLGATKPEPKSERTIKSEIWTNIKIGFMFGVGVFLVIDGIGTIRSSKPKNIVLVSAPKH